jgi:transposase
MRGQLAEFGSIVAKGPCHVAKLLAKIADIPAIARPILQLLADQLRTLDEKIAQLDQELAHRVKRMRKQSG